MSKKINIGLFGFGNVGQGFSQLLASPKNQGLEIKTIGIKHLHKHSTSTQFKFTTSLHEIIDDPEIDLVVELIDDSDVAFEILKASLQKRKPVVTANKKMLAENLEAVYTLQKKYLTPVRYEGAVCGSIPIIQNLESYYAYENIERIEGIVNGSTNFILTKMTEEKIEFEQALDQAKALAFAESDPSLDINGNDAKYKLAILIAHTYGIIVDPEDIITIGIDRITQQDIRFAVQQDCTVKLIAKVEKRGNKLFAIVAPQFISTKNPLSRIRNEFNGVNIKGEFAGAQHWNGKGAGGLPTGLAVLADVVQLSNNSPGFYQALNNERDLTLKTGLLNVHVRFDSSAQIGSKDFAEFQGGFHGHHFQTMEGWITPQKLTEWRDREDLSIILKKGQNIRENTTKKIEEFQLI
jgi:homoserine dehydrogenase